MGASAMPAPPAAPAAEEPSAAGLGRFLDAPSGKVLTEGAHRAAALARTLERARAAAPAAGITRVGFLTGLDHVGVPVAMAVRPAARSAAISLGKGLSDAHAEASAMMESLECWHAERMDERVPLIDRAPARLDRPALDLDRLPPLSERRFDPDAPIPWVEALELFGGEPVLAPYETVHAAYTHPLPRGSGAFFASTNGLASGNTRLEALIHALTELIERDATTLWMHEGDQAREARRVDPDSVDDPACRGLIDRFRAAGFDLGIWETTSDVAVPAYFAWIMEGADTADGAARSAIGQGCHLAPEIALSRALTEAAQHRLTVISGARDDLGEAEYAEPDAETQALRRALLREGAAPRRFAAAPRFVSDDLAEDAAHVLARLRAVGIAQAAAVDLTRPELGVAVVRAVVPGLEGPHDHDRYAPGARAEAVSRAARSA